MGVRGNYSVTCEECVLLRSIMTSSPTCEDLGIPLNGGEAEMEVTWPLLTRRIVRCPGLYLDGLRYEAETQRVAAPPYSSFCMITLPNIMAMHAANTGTKLIRERNERERERVRCVKEGYDRLKEHLPHPVTDRHISKIETLRAAIDYIRLLQQTLERNPPQPMENVQTDTKKDEEAKTLFKSKTICNLESLRPVVEEERSKH